MAIWQAMKGESRNPKQHWDSKDLEYQHFSRASGQQFEGHIKKDDLILIYWPGKSIYMDLQTAVEAGPGTDCHFRSPEQAGGRTDCRLTAIYGSWTRDRELVLL